MAKYDPLRDHLRRQKLAELEMTFADIEQRIGGMLPKSAQRPQWWENASEPAHRHVQQRAWADAGFDAFLVAGRERVRFRRRAPG